MFKFLKFIKSVVSVLKYALPIIEAVIEALDQLETQQQSKDIRQEPVAA